MAARRQPVRRGRVRPLRKRLEEAREKVDRLELQDKIAELRDRVRRRTKRRDR